MKQHYAPQNMREIVGLYVGLSQEVQTVLTINITKIKIVAFSDKRSTISSSFSDYKVALGPTFTG